MSDNLQDRVDAAVALVEGPKFTSNLMPYFKCELLKQRIFRLMFGDGGERVYIKEMPNINEEITPLLLLRFNADTFNSIDSYFTGSIDAVIGLPVQVTGDLNALKQVADTMQRFLGGPMNMFTSKDPTTGKITYPNPGLIKFGYGAEFKYGGMFDLSGIKLPAIEFTLPFQFDLQQAIIQCPGVDFFADLDVANLPWITQVTVGVEPTDNNLNPVTPSIELEVTSETGQTN